MKLEDLERKLESVTRELVEITELTKRMEDALRSIKEVADESRDAAELSELLEAAKEKWGEMDTATRVIMAIVKLQYVQGRVDQMRDDMRRGIEPSQGSLEKASSLLDTAIRELEAISDLKRHMKSILEKAEGALDKIKEK
ncbi:MAG: hypothetical protein DRN96_08190 [Thermoproteota archaeon]|nr:MAG: hypothetical protein DRN96_08190 [Candidatus Korarchaeota archaeon]